MDLTTYYTTFHDPLWIILLSTALFFPVRKLIWVLYVRKTQNAQNHSSKHLYGESSAQLIVQSNTLNINKKAKIYTTIN